MRSRFIVAGALLGASLATSCFIPGFEVIEDGDGETGGGGNTTGGSGSGGTPLGGNGGEGCRPDPFDGRLSARGQQTNGPVLTVDVPASIQLEDGAYQTARGFDATVAQGNITVASGPDFFGWDEVEVQATDGCETFPVSVDLRTSPVAGGALADVTDAVVTGFSGSLSLGSADVNGDGVPDLIVGSPGDIGDNGEVAVILGGPHLLRGTVDTSFLTTEDLPGFVVTGNPGERLGYSVAGAGDVNCTGFDSIVLGATSATVGGDGNAYVVYGSPTPTNVDLAAANDEVRFQISGAGIGTGYAVAGGQDVNADGVSDIVVSSPWADPATGTNAGVVSVLFGGFAGCECDDAGTCATSPLSALDVGTESAGFLVLGPSNSRFVGTHVSLLGDVYSTSGSEVGATQQQAAHAVWGRGTNTDVSLAGASPATVFTTDLGIGAVTTRAGSFDGDADPDWSYCLRLNGSNEPVCRIVRGNEAPDIQVTGFSDEVPPVHAVTFGGRFNDDDRDELVFYEPESAWVVFGTNASGTIDVSDLGASGFQLTGDAGADWTAHSLGDVDGDGFSELVIADATSGKIYVLRGGP